MRGAEMHAFPSATQLIRHMSFELNSRDHMFQAQIGYISNLQPTTFTGIVWMLLHHTEAATTTATITTASTPPSPTQLPQQMVEVMISVSQPDQQSCEMLLIYR
ncbi:hypothetical protein T4A_3815 [Trichinella pseudospiralis]|uniref:Uncharacterized protein n=1 Tax=Trichinella pseudospiralis TaxID=6337 RepID=A0A0V1F2E8_TRIPS|nr:hypothetical protein T4A_3815 [Trichinella pseudospiralis]